MLHKNFKKEKSQYVRLNFYAGNCELAFRLAEDELGIPSLLEVEDVIRNPDRLSLLTYLSQFYHTLSSTGRDSGISSLSESPSCSDCETDTGHISRRSTSLGNRRGAVLSLMEMDGDRGGRQRQSRSMSVKTSKRHRPASPPIHQENPFIGDHNMEQVLLPTTGQCKRQVLRRHRGHPAKSGEAQRRQVF